VRRAIRRAKQVRHRHQRVPLEVPPGESGSEQLPDEENDAEKIEVHVHLHRGEIPKSSRARPAPRPVLSGRLFDWQWYGDRLTARPPPAVGKRWGFATKCENCDTLVPSRASHCPRCAAPQLRRRYLPLAVALVGLGSIALLFAVCAHVLGGSVPEHQAPQPAGQWTDDDYTIVEMPSTPSPFAYTPSTSSGSKATR
jgi:hypothetical protein